MMFAVELYSRFALNTNRSGSAGSAICMLTNLKKINFFFLLIQLKHMEYAVAQRRKKPELSHMSQSVSNYQYNLSTTCITIVAKEGGKYMDGWFIILRLNNRPVLLSLSTRLLLQTIFQKCDFLKTFLYCIV